MSVSSPENNLRQENLPGPIGPDNTAPTSHGHVNPSTMIRWRFTVGRGDRGDKLPLPQAHPRNPEYDGSIVLNKQDPCCVVRALMV